MTMASLIPENKNQYLPTLIKALAHKIIPKIRVLKKEPLRMNARPFPQLSKIDLRPYKCDSYITSTYRNIYAINTVKYKYCYNIYKELEAFEMKDFQLYLKNVSNAIVSMNDLKKSIYCAVCDYQMLQNFDLAQKRIYLNDNFCNSFLNRYKAYLLWKNVHFIEYVYNLFQYIECHESPGMLINFPFKNFLDKHLRLSFFVKRCLENLNGPDYL